MMKHFMFVLTALLLSIAGAAHAGPGHDHGNEAPKTAGVSSPRLEAHSDLFELVGILENGALTVYLDRYSDNQPITQAVVEYESGANKGKATPNADGTYTIAFDELSKAKDSLAFTFTISYNNQVDLLAADLVIQTAEQAAPAHHHWPTWAYGLIAIALGGVAFITVRLIRRKKSPYAASILAAWCSVGLLILITLTSITAPSPAVAHDGHDHGDHGPAASGNVPQRMPDGSVFLPKPSQRQLNIRTTTVQESSSAKSVQLNGRVIADPGASGAVQATQAGRIEAARVGARLPGLGERVVAGQVLAVVRPSIGAVERANQAAMIGELNANLGLAKRKLARLEQLEGTVAQREIDAARAEVAALNERSRAVGGSLGTVETLKAPISGVISIANARAGQVIDAREMLYEIIDPTQLRVEAASLDANLPTRIQTAAITVGNATHTLALKGAGRSLRDGAIPIQFALTADQKTGEAASPLVVGQPITVFVQTTDAIKGIRLPASAVVKNPSNQAIVWKHDHAEQFVPLMVTTEQLDGQTVLITSGVKPGTRIVTQGASLVNQVR